MKCIVTDADMKSMTDTYAWVVSHMIGYCHRCRCVCHARLCHIYEYGMSHMNVWSREECGVAHKGMGRVKYA